MLFGLLFFYSGIPAFAQPCPPPDDCGDFGPEQYERFITINPSCRAIVNFRSRFCPDEGYQYLITGVSYMGTCEAMRDLTVYQYDLSVAFETITRGFIKQRARQDFPNMADCSDPNPSDTSYNAQVYTASCGVWVKCTYDVDVTTRTCERGFEEPFLDYGTPSKVDVYRFQDCGTTCCKRTFRYCSIGPGRSVHIELVSTEQITACSDAEKYQTIPCQDGCL